MKITVRASSRLTSGVGVFASGHEEAGKALKSVGNILGGNFVIDESGPHQKVVWRAPQFIATLALDTDNDILEFDFKDKANAGSFSAEGYNVSELIKDIRYNVTQFKPTKTLDPRVQQLRQKFENVQ